MNLKKTIIDKAKHIGLEITGSAILSEPKSSDIFHKWLDKGYCAGMSYLRRGEEPRNNPELILAGAKSVIVSALKYPVNTNPSSGFSTYARGMDYHIVMKNKLFLLADFIRKILPSAKTRVCVDSAPVFEREWAVRAGIGWIGKQGQIINPLLGACFFLGEIFLDIELEPSEPLKNMCGDCRLCVEACPARAIMKNSTVNANLCVSYLTVEHDGNIPEKQHTVMESILYGCDRCTAVCPWNRKRDTAIPPEFKEQTMPTAEEILDMTETEFKERFKDSAVLRSGLNRLKRNASIALANALS